MMFTTCLWTTIPNGLCRDGVGQNTSVGRRFRKDTDMEMNEKLKLQAYYYGFSETGVRSIDLVLRAVSAAGKLFHHTDQWTSEINYPVENVRGPAPVDWIQNAADDAADAYKKLQSTLATTQAALEAKEKECELAAKYVEQEYNGASLPDSPVLALLEIARERGKQFERVMSERDTALAEVERLRGELEIAQHQLEDFRHANDRFVG